MIIRQSHCKENACLRARSCKAEVRSVPASTRRSVTRIPIQKVNAISINQSQAIVSPLRKDKDRMLPVPSKELLVLGPRVGVPERPVPEKPTLKPINPYVVCPSSTETAVQRTS